MRLDAGQPRRLLIYTVYDPQGVVDRYVLHMMQALRQCVEEICVVVNGALTTRSREQLERAANLVLVRPNEGLDVWGYKTGLDHYGWEALESFDEVLLMNDTLLGPVYPFAEMFASMDCRDLDFWGITKHAQINYDVFGTTRWGYIPEHIQSCFMAVRRSMVKDAAFRAYWERLPQYRTYAEVVGGHEVAFTKTFEDLGFVSGAYGHMESLYELSPNPLMFAPTALLEAHRCPVFKRRLFFGEYRETLTVGGGEIASRLYAYLREHTTYDLDMLWENLLRTCNLADIRYNLHLTHVLSPAEGDHIPGENPQHVPKVALILAYGETDRIQEIRRFADNMPPAADLYIQTDSEAKRQDLLDAFEGAACGRLEIRVRGDGACASSAMTETFPKEAAAYELICCAQHLSPGETPWTVLATSGYVGRVISLFAANPRMGILCAPPEPSVCQGEAWESQRFAQVEALLRRMGVTAPMGKDRPLIAPWGGAFWCRPKALGPLLARGGQAEAQTTEAAMGLIAQSQGFYTAWGMPADHIDAPFARVEPWPHHVLPSEANAPGGETIGKAGLILWVTDPAGCGSLLRRAASMPEGSPVCLVVRREGLRQQVAADCAAQGLTRTRIVSDGRSHTVYGALRAGYGALRGACDYLCFAHQRALDGAPVGQDARAQIEMQQACLLGSQWQVRRLLGVFAQHPQLGILSPPRIWQACNAEKFLCPQVGQAAVRRALRRLRMPGNQREEGRGAAPWGGMFWCRVAALAALLDNEGKSGFADAPLLRAVPYVAGHAGYSAGTVMNEASAAVALDGILWRQTQAGATGAARYMQMLKAHLPVPVANRLPELKRMLQRSPALKPAAKFLYRTYRRLGG